MDTIEKIKWLPIWLILFTLIFTTGSYFYKQSMLTSIGDVSLSEAARKGKFTTQDVEELIDRVGRLGFNRGDIQVEISPARALNTGVSKEDNEYITLIIDPRKKALLSTIFDLLTPGENKVKYYYTRITKSEEYIN